ncbi:MAG: hypothetical protein RIB58_06770 [Phycisphaerales bacterium]
MNGLAPIWISGPLAMLALVVVAAHLMAMRGATMPESRKRIRTANGWLILITVPMLAIAFSVVSPQQPRQFALVWAVAMMLIALVIIMAFVDMANNLRLSRKNRQKLQRELGRQLRSSLANEGHRER